MDVRDQLDSNALLTVTVTALADKTFRTHINEKNPLKPR